MNFEIRPSPEGEWLKVGSWFDAFIDLAQKLHEAQRSIAYKKILISVPQSDMVSLALAIGFSRAAFLGGQAGSEAVELDELALGDLIQLRSVWQRAPDKIMAAENVVGRVVELDKSKNDSVGLKFSFNTSNAVKPWRVMKSRSPKGLEKNPLKHIRFYRVSEGTPQRHGKALREFKNPSSHDRELQQWILGWENWEYQVDPSLLIFGSPTRISDYGRPLFRDLELHRLLLKIDSDSLLNVARLDSLTHDVKPHFVNAIDQIASFPTFGSPAFDSFRTFPFVCLDGNAAILELADRVDLDSKCVIALWETSKATLQESALGVFVSNATRYTPVIDFERHIGWRAPAGVQCWGWV